MVVAGKAHPLDDNAKQMLVDVFGLSQAVGLTSRVAFLENYDLSVAAPIVGGCDVWLNLPRPPLEAAATPDLSRRLTTMPEPNFSIDQLYASTYAPTRRGGRPSGGPGP